MGIENCELVSDEALSDCISGIHDLHFLSMDSCGFVGARVMQSIAEKHINLVDLFVNKCAYIDDTSLAKVAHSCVKVRIVLHHGTETIIFYFSLS